MHEIDFLRVIRSEPDRCSYLENQIARMPLSLPSGPLSPEQLDQLLAAGYRRSGWFFYRTQCPRCSACEPLRLDVDTFRPSRSQRRALRLGEQHLRLKIAEPIIDERRLELFNRHRTERALSSQETPAGAAEYRSFLLNAYCDVLELSLWLDDVLTAVSITDVGRRSLSAVYCYFDPAAAWLSPGTYAILQQVELARARDFRWLYLGMYVAANSHLKYKARFRPHQRWIDGAWRNEPTA